MPARGVPSRTAVHVHVEPVELHPVVVGEGVEIGREPLQVWVVYGCVVAPLQASGQHSDELGRGGEQVAVGWVLRRSSASYPEASRPGAPCHLDERRALRGRLTASGYGRQRVGHRHRAATSQANGGLSDSAGASRQQRLSSICSASAQRMARGVEEPQRLYQVINQRRDDELGWLCGVDSRGAQVRNSGRQEGSGG